MEIVTGQDAVPARLSAEGHSGAVSHGLGGTVKVIVLSIPKIGQFEALGEKGVNFPLIEWIEEHFSRESLMGIPQEDDTVVEGMFDV